MIKIRTNELMFWIFITIGFILMINGIFIIVNENTSQSDNNQISQEIDVTVIDKNPITRGHPDSIETNKGTFYFRYVNDGKIFYDRMIIGQNYTIVVDENNKIIGVY